jgi:hypothetical protein
MVLKAAMPYPSSRIANITCASSGHQRRQLNPSELLLGWTEQSALGSEMLAQSLFWTCKENVLRSWRCACVCGLGDVRVVVWGSEWNSCRVVQGWEQENYKTHFD